MADSENSDGRMRSSSRLLHPWLLKFQKLGLELKCPLCLSLLNRPTVLPCDHVVCNSCMPGSTQFGAACPVCKAHFIDRDARSLPLVENMLKIYKCLDATFSADLFPPVHSDAERVAMQSAASIDVRFGDKMNEELLENALGDKSLSGQSLDKQYRVDKNGKVENRQCKRKDKGIEFNGAKNPILSSPRSRMRGGGTEECISLEVDVNPAAQSSPHGHSPTSSGDAGGSDNDNYYRYSQHRSNKSLVKRSSKKYNYTGGKLKNDGSGFEKDGNFGEVKRQKKLNFSLEQLDVSNADHVQAVSNAGALMTSVQTPKSSDDHCANRTICAFCHSSEISEDTGKMLHYSSAKMVVGYEATLPNVIHVHKVCLDWTPRVYYVDKRVKNLKEEVARGGKLKCSSCGKKGAALGCYVRACRRSYHVPCAMKVSKCRWDYENYLILCPDHSSVRFPSENSESGKNISKDYDMPALVSCQLSKLVPSQDGEKKLFFCGSALSTDEKILLVKFGNTIGATVSTFWSPKVTHLIAATDDKGACTRTFKFLMAISTGKWIVKVDWIKACMEAKCHVNEEPYEVRLDNYGCCDGPKTGRLRASLNTTKLFSGLNFFFVGDFPASYKEDLQDLVVAAGGTILKSSEELVALSHDEEAPTPRPLVVYNIDPPEGCKLGDKVAILFQRLSEAEDIASQTGSRVIAHTWLLESIAVNK